MAAKKSGGEGRQLPLPPLHLPPLYSPP